MTHEFQYTSAEQTLQPGLKGFGPVVVSRGLPATLQEKLVVLSAYRHLYSVQDPKAKLNPVNHSHLIIPASGKPYHVLSRVSDAGFDYSHRSNKFAHHVAFEASERPPSGPAAILAAVGFMSLNFSGSPRWLDQGRPLPQLMIKPTICRAWHAVTGDAGWGGVLAGSALPENPPTVIVVYRAGLDVLPLVAEAMALLPDERRWQVTFSTFYQKLPPGVACQWRFMPTEDPETKTAVKALNVKVIDLTRKLDKPVPSAWVEAARTGHRPALPRQPAGKNSPLLLVPDKNSSARANGAAANLGSLQLDPLTSSDLINWDALPAATPLPVAIPVHPANRGKWMIVIAVGVMVLVAAAFFVIHTRRDGSEAVAAAPVEPPPRPATPIKFATPAPVTLAKVDPPTAKRVATPVAVVPDAASQPIASLDRSPPAEPPRTIVSQPPAPMTDSVLIDPFMVLRKVRAESLGLPLPSVEPMSGAATKDGEVHWVEVIELPHIECDRLELQLNAPKGAKARFALVASSPTKDERTWQVLRLTGSPAGDDELGRLRLAGDRLQFAWSHVTAGMQPQLLGGCWLTFVYGEERETVRWQVPTPLAERDLKWNSNELEFAKTLPWNAQQRLVVSLADGHIPATDASTRSIVIAPGERRILLVPVTTDGNVAIETAIRATSRAPCKLSLDYALLCKMIGVNGVQTIERHPFRAEALHVARALAENRVAELSAAESDELAVWRQRLSQYELTRKWSESSQASTLQLRCRVFRREDLE